MVAQAGRDPFRCLEVAQASRVIQEQALRTVLDYKGPIGGDRVHDPSLADDKILFRIISTAIQCDRLTDLGPDALNIFLERGASGTDLEYAIPAFHDLPTGTLSRLIGAAGMSLNGLARTASVLTHEDQRELYSMLDADRQWVIYRHADQFTFTTPAKILDIARERGRLDHIADSLGIYTDGSDQDLIVELLNASGKNGFSIARNINRLPNLDTAWFVSQLEQRGSVDAIIECVGKTPGIDEVKVLDQLLATTPDVGKLSDLLMYNLKNFDAANSDSIFEKLMQAGVFEVIAANPGFFIHETPARIYALLIEHPSGMEALAHRLYNFPEAEVFDLATRLAEHGQIHVVVDNFMSFTHAGVDPKWIFAQALDSTQALGSLLYNTRYEQRIRDTGISVEQIFEALLQRPDGLKAIGDNLQLISPALQDRYLQECIDRRHVADLRYQVGGMSIDRLKAIQRCFEAGLEEVFYANWDSAMLNAIPGKSDLTAAQLLEWGGAAVVLSHPSMYPVLTPEQVARAYEMLLSRNDAILVRTVARSTFGAPDSIAERILQSSSPSMLVVQRQLFRPEYFTLDVLTRYLATESDKFADLYEYSGLRIDWADKAFGIFGRECASVVVVAVRELLLPSAEPLPPYLASLGITNRGTTGMQELKRVLDEIRTQLLHDSNEVLPNLTANIVLNPLGLRIAQSMVRYNSSQWGMHSREAWIDTVASHIKTRTQHAPLPPEFVPSASYTIASLDARAFDPSRFDTDARERYAALQSNIQNALAIADAPSQRSSIYALAKEALQAELVSLEARRADMTQRPDMERAMTGIDRRISTVRSVLEMQPREVVRTLRTEIQRLTALGLPSLDDAIRTALFARAIKLNPTARVMAEQLQHGLSFDTLSMMTDFVDHIVNREVYGTYFTGPNAKGARRAFEKLSSTAALSAQIAKTQSGQASGQTTLKFVPTRGLLLEFSGHTGDACWANKYPSIAEAFPNISAVTFVRNPDTPNERFVGSCLLIDTVDQVTGEPVLVLRGVNPIENYITQVKVPEFTEALLHYVRSIANGRKVAMVIDGRSGAAATNRPVLFQYLNDEVKSNMTVGAPLKLPSDTTFNGYILAPGEHPAYVIRDNNLLLI